MHNGLRHPFCFRHAHDEIGVDVAPSTIPNSGLGLFASHSCRKGDVLVHSKGKGGKNPVFSVLKCGEGLCVVVVVKRIDFENLSRKVGACPRIHVLYTFLVREGTS